MNENEETLATVSYLIWELLSNTFTTSELELYENSFKNEVCTMSDGAYSRLCEIYHKYLHKYYPSDRLNFNI